MVNETSRVQDDNKDYSILLHSDWNRLPPKITYSFFTCREERVREDTEEVDEGGGRFGKGGGREGGGAEEKGTTSSSSVSLSSSLSLLLMSGRSLLSKSLLQLPTELPPPTFSYFPFPSFISSAW